jgi:hypothetical protein
VQRSEGGERRCRPGFCTRIGSAEAMIDTLL